jgi:hypothetical protein
VSSDEQSRHEGLPPTLRDIFDPSHLLEPPFGEFLVGPVSTTEVPAPP